MKKLLWTIPLAVFFLSGCGFASTSNTTSTPISTNNSQVKTSSSQKLSDQPYFKNAYLISTDALSTDAKTALAGFKMSKQTMPDGTSKIDLKALEAQYHDQSYTLKNGEQLYFIDKFLADDQGNTEANIGDDTAVIVDSQGNIVQPPSGF